MKLVLGMVCWGGARETLEHCTVQSYAPAVQAARAVGIDPWVLPFRDAGDRPLGARHNLMLEAVRALDPDGFILVGSDDWMDANCFVRYAERLRKGPLHILNDIYVADAQTGALVTYGSPGIGVGRALRRDVLEACGWRLWPDNATGMLDHAMALRILTRHRGGNWIRYNRSPGEVVIDIKTEQNLWGFERFERRGLTVPRAERQRVFDALAPGALAALRQRYPEFHA